MSNEKEIQVLEAKIKNAIAQIAEKKVTPAESEIGKMFKTLKEYDEASFQVHLELYKPVSNAYTEALKSRSKRTKAEQDALEFAVLNSVARGGTSIGSDYDDTKSGSSGRKAGAPKVPKVKVPKAPKAQGTGEEGERDRTAYEIDGVKYGKGPAVHAIIKKYCSLNPDITLAKLKVAFPDDLHRGYGVVTTHEIAAEMFVTTKRKRHFLKDEHLIKIKDCTVAICNQWGVGNITPFIDNAVKLGLEIKTCQKD